MSYRRWLRDVSRAAEDFAKACDDFKIGLGQGIRRETPDTIQDKAEDVRKAKDEGRTYAEVAAERVYKTYNPLDAEKLQGHWVVRCTECGVRFSFASRCLPPSQYDPGESDPDGELSFWDHLREYQRLWRMSAEVYLHERGWKSRGCGRWEDSYICARCPGK